jgi:predicted 2-oxoglutarate/Fe(II)-dependent dioxygenase YbiX
MRYIFFMIVLIIFIFLLLPTYIKPKVYHGLITEEERRHIIEKARTRLKSSTVSNDKNIRIDEKVRVSETAFLSHKDDPIVERVMRRCLKNCDRRLCNCESLQVVRYKPGGFYIPHNDAFERGELDYKNNRKYTFLIALNDDYEGGETEFPNLDKKYKLQAGDVLRFNNLDNYGLVTSKALHGGTPVKKGEKWICNVWVHTHPYGL